MARPELEAAIASLALTVESVFVPWSKSRNYKPTKTMDGRTLNWRVTLRQNGREIVTTDYSAGIAHCPSYGQGKRWTNDYADAIAFECEKGFGVRTVGHLAVVDPKKPILPDPIDVVWSLAQESDVLNAGSFEEWASDFGYDKDSRRAEGIYRACLDNALKLQSRLGPEALALLQKAGEDY